MSQLEKGSATGDILGTCAITICVSSSSMGIAHLFQWRHGDSGIWKCLVLWRLSADARRHPPVDVKGKKPTRKSLFPFVDRVTTLQDVDVFFVTWILLGRPLSITF